MPWVTACLNLLAEPVLGYCLAVRNLALHAGVLQEVDSKINEMQKIAMTPGDGTQGKKHLFFLFFFYVLKKNNNIF